MVTFGQEQVSTTIHRSIKSRAIIGKQFDSDSSLYGARITVLRRHTWLKMSSLQFTHFAHKCLSPQWCKRDSEQTLTRILTVLHVYRVACFFDLSAKRDRRFL